jgi:hypothetical protein
MGDSKRNTVFASFIRRNYGRFQSILVVADGKGELSKELVKQGFLVRVIERKPRFDGNLPKGLQYTKGCFSENTFVKEDVIVGMHPDEATVEIVLAAKKNGKRFAVVPCCFKGRFSDNIDSSHAWISRLKKLYGHFVNETVLPIGGKNIVLYT